jgi:transcriptional regulator with XRE-family HTH domain
VINIRDTALIKAFGKHVRILRSQKKITMEKLAELADIDYTQIAKIERGKINTTISTANAIAKGLNISLKELFDFDQQKD